MLQSLLQPAKYFSSEEAMGSLDVRVAFSASTQKSLHYIVVHENFQEPLAAGDSKEPQIMLRNWQQMANLRRSTAMSHTYTPRQKGKRTYRQYE